MQDDTDQLEASQMNDARMIANDAATGAIITNVFVIHVSPVMPLLLLFGTTAVAWARRDQLRIVLTSTRPA